MNPAGHWFWFALTAAVVIWYSTITVYVAVRGAFDIKGMLGRLGVKRDAAIAEEKRLGR